MVFVLLGNKKHIFLLGGFALAFIILYQPEIYSYNHTMRTFEPANGKALNDILGQLYKIDILHILNTDYYKKEVFAILISCPLMYMLKDIQLQYSLSRKKILIIESAISILAMLFLLNTLGLLSTTSIYITYYLIVIGMVLISAIIAKGCAGAISLSDGWFKTFIGFLFMLLPWILSLCLNPYYNTALNEGGLLLWPLILIGTLALVFYIIETCNTPLIYTSSKSSLVG
jgi:hypothetical protein